MDTLRENHRYQDMIAEIKADMGAQLKQFHEKQAHASN
jgi:hypothetical protein